MYDEHVLMLGWKSIQRLVILNPENMHKAKVKVISNKGVAGTDGNNQKPRIPERRI